MHTNNTARYACKKIVITIVDVENEVCGECKTYETKGAVLEDGRVVTYEDGVDGRDSLWASIGDFQAHGCDTVDKVTETGETCEIGIDELRDADRDNRELSGETLLTDAELIEFVVTDEDNEAPTYVKAASAREALKASGLNSGAVWSVESSSYLCRSYFGQGAAEMLISISDAPAAVVELLDPCEYAATAGAELARQIKEQGGEPGTFDRAGDLPDSDYVDMKRKFGEVTADMEKAYKRAYNAAASE